MMNPAVHCALGASRTASTIATTTALTTTAVVAGAAASANHKKKKDTVQREPIGTRHVHGKQENHDNGDNGITTLVFDFLKILGIALIVVFIGIFVVSLLMPFVDWTIGAGKKSSEFIQEVVKDTAHGITNGIKSGYGYVSGGETVEFDGETFVIPKGHRCGTIESPFTHLKIYQNGNLVGDFSGTFLFHMDNIDNPKEITVIGKEEGKFEKTVYKNNKLRFEWTSDWQ